MMRREKIHALILARKNSGEADRFLTLFTRDYGLLRVVAKGVRKIPSRRGGHLEPLTHALVIISGGPGHYFLAAVETQHEHLTLRRDTVARAHAQTLAHLPIYLFEEAEVNATLFDAVHHAWQILPDLEIAKQQTLVTAVTLHALRCAGLMPDLAACQACGVQQPTDAVIMDARGGGWRCLPCLTSLSGTRLSLSPRLLKAVRFIARYPERALQVRLAAEESQQIGATIQEYVEHTIGKSLLSPPAPLLTPLLYAQ
ncbi:MAG: DNA repair protein RecO [Candidatus Andersenbacteria bacterium]